MIVYDIEYNNTAAYKYSINHIVLGIYNNNSIYIEYGVLWWVMVG